MSSGELCHDRRERAISARSMHRDRPHRRDDDFRRSNRLRQVHQRPPSREGPRALRMGSPGQKDQADVELFVKQPRRFRLIERSGRVGIHDRQLWTKPPPLSQRLDGVAHAADFVAGHLERLGKIPSHDRLVLDDQNSPFCHCVRGKPPLTRVHNRTGANGKHLGIFRGWRERTATPCAQTDGGNSETNREPARAASIAGIKSSNRRIFETYPSMPTASASRAVS